MSKTTSLILLSQIIYLGCDIPNDEIPPSDVKVEIEAFNLLDDAETLSSLACVDNTYINSITSNSAINGMIGLLYNKDILDYQCDITDSENFFNELQTIEDECSKEKECSISCAKNVTAFYNKCRQNISGTYITENELESYLPHEGYQDYIEACYNNMCSLIDYLKTTVDRINSIHRTLVTDSQYSEVYASLEYENIRDRLLKYGDYIKEDMENIDSNILKKINDCIDYLDGPNIDIETFLSEECKI